jgi:hypothetical protein
LTETTPQRERIHDEAVSAALRQAMLASERLRIQGVLAVLAILFAVVVVRWALAPRGDLVPALHALLMLVGYGAGGDEGSEEPVRVK